MPWFLYILLCDGRLYTGITTNVERRVRQHKGELVGGAKFTQAAEEISLVYAVALGERRTAARAEYRLKQLPRPAKLAIVAEQPTAANLLERLAMNNEQ
ncbi:MAG: GIY-YIG nuclease family protein [Chloroflexi bacterium]|nr:GIY-YIG nuclease family protein [Chloroflexota bacterium]